MMTDCLALKGRNLIARGAAPRYELQNANAIQYG